MSKTLVLSLGAAVALVTAAVALAVVYTASGVSATTAGFSTDKVSPLKTSTCTGTDGKSFTLTHGHYTGTATFAAPAADLGGALTIDARTTYSTTDGLGYVDGSFRVKNDPSRLSGRFTGTLKGTQLVGFLTAESRGHHARVLGNLSATFVPATGFTAGAVGSTSSTAVLAVVAGPVCKGPKPAPKPEPKHPVTVNGDVTGLDTVLPDMSITLAPKHGPAQTCAIDSSSPSTASFPIGTKNVEMRCNWVGTPTAVLTLRELHKHK